MTDGHAAAFTVDGPAWARASGSARRGMARQRDGQSIVPFHIEADQY